MIASTRDDDTDVHNPGGFTGVTQQYPYGRLYNLYLDPKESRSYLIRKLAYIEVLREGMRAHLATFQAYPPKRVMGLRAPAPGHGRSSLPIAGATRCMRGRGPRRSTSKSNLAIFWPECGMRSSWPRRRREPSGRCRPTGGPRCGTPSNGTCGTSPPG